MGKIVVCTEEKDFDYICSNFDNLFNRYVTFHSNGLCIRAYGKLRIANTNVYSNNDEFVMGVGTYIYKSCIGVAALEKIYEDLKDNRFYRDSIIGSYCMLIKEQDKITIFIDRSNTYNIYYSLHENQIILTNTYFHVASALDSSRRKVNIDNLVAQVFQSSIIGDETLYEGVKRLDGNTLLIHDSNIWYLRSDRLKASVVDQYIWDYAAERYDSIGKLYNSSSIFMTGGEDSRINLSIMKRIGFKPTLLYGIGNSANTFTKKEDLDIVQQIGELESLPVSFMNWNESDETEMSSYWKRYGEMYTLYRFNKNIFREFEECIDTEFVCFGYFGEVYRNIERIEEYKKPIFSLEDFVDDLYINTSLKLFYYDYCQFRNKLIEQFSFVCDEKNLDKEHLTREDFQKLNTAYRYRADTVMNNFANQFFYSFPFLSDSIMIEMIENMKFVKKNGSKMILEGINYFAPELLGVPFFSHIKMKRFDKNSFELIDINASANYKERIRKMVHNETLLKILRKLYYISKHDKKGLKEIEDSYLQKEVLRVELLNNSLSFINTDTMVKVTDARIIKNLLLYVKQAQSLSPF